MNNFDRHNTVAPDVLRTIVNASDSEAEAMIILESVLLGVLLYYRPNPRQAAEFLDELTRGALVRMNRTA